MAFSLWGEGAGLYDVRTLFHVDTSTKIWIPYRFSGRDILLRSHHGNKSSHPVPAIFLHRLTTGNCAGDPEAWPDWPPQ